MKTLILTKEKLLVDPEYIACCVQQISLRIGVDPSEILFLSIESNITDYTVESFSISDGYKLSRVLFTPAVSEGPLSPLMSIHRAINEVISAINEPDYVFFESNGLVPYYPLHAKLTKLAYLNTCFIAFCDEPIRLHNRCNGVFPNSRKDVVNCWLEEEALRLACLTIFKSESLRSWALEESQEIDCKSLVMHDFELGSLLEKNTNSYETQMGCTSNYLYSSTSMFIDWKIRNIDDMDSLEHNCVCKNEQSSPQFDASLDKGYLEKSKDSEKILPLSITVCVAHFQRPALLAEALQSLCNQTDSNFDVIVVDDGSSDEYILELYSVIDCYKDILQITLIEQKNMYLGAARNTAWKAAVSEYVLFMDDDNLAIENEIEIFRKAAESHSSDIYVCFSDVFYSGKSTIDIRENSSVQARVTPLGACHSLGSSFNYFGDSNSLWKRSILREIGGFHEIHGVGKEDNEIFMRATLSGAKLGVIPETLFYYRISPNRMRNYQRNIEDGTYAVSDAFASLCNSSSLMGEYLIGLERYVSLLEKRNTDVTECLIRTQRRLEIYNRIENSVVATK